MSTNNVTWWEFPVRDTGAAQKFYGAVFGWTFDESFPGYPMISAPDGDMPMGAFDTLEEGTNRGARPFVQVDDLEATLDRVTAAGGTVATGRTLINAEMGWWALMRDGEDREFGLWTMNPATD